MDLSYSNTIEQSKALFRRNTCCIYYQSYLISIILVSHDLNMVARYADRVVLLNKTVICTGTPDEVLVSENLQQAFGPAYPLNNLKNRVKANMAGGVFI